METLLLVLIVVLTGTICALAGLWFHHATQEDKASARPPQFAHGATGHAHWDGVARASRDKF